MSSRYGRQKRRQHRKLVSELKEQLHSARAIASSQTARNSELTDVIHDCAEVLGTNFIGLPPLVAGGHVTCDAFRIHLPSFDMAINVANPTNPEAISNLHLLVKEVEIMRSSTTVDRVSQAIHFQIRHPTTGKIAYCINRDEMRSMPKDIMVKTISKQMALMLWQDLQGLKNENSERYRVRI